MHACMGQIINMLHESRERSQLYGVSKCRGMQLASCLIGHFNDVCMAPGTYQLKAQRTAYAAHMQEHHIPAC